MENLIKTGNVISSGLVHARKKLHGKLRWFPTRKYANSDVLNGNQSSAYQLEPRQESASSASVAILLCTFNGDRFLRGQLESFHTQHHKNFTLHVSDDGSQDGTYLTLKRFQSQLGEGRISLKTHPNLGVVGNFLSLVCRSDIEADYYAFADQDDVWDQDKLARAIQKLENAPSDIPALYCSRTRLIDEHGNDIGLFPLFPKPPGFSNALVQNIAGGNTMVMNRAAQELLCKAGVHPVVLHDWWTYLLISGAGGNVFYDTHPSVAYRQHGNNFHGANTRWRDRLTRFKMMCKGEFRNMVNKNIKALWEIRHLLTPDNQKRLAKFCESREVWLLPRLLGMKKAGIYRQSFKGNIMLALAVILNKI